MKHVCGFLLLFFFACSPGPKSGEARIFYDSLLQDSVPVKLMRDTVLVSAEYPLIIRDRASSDSVQIFPYTLIFEGASFDTYVVSFTDFSPTLITLDKEKLVIDSMMLIARYPPNTSSYRHTTHATISGLDHIRVNDSVFTWEVTPQNTRREETMKVKTSEKIYTIGSDGVIQ